MKPEGTSRMEILIVYRTQYGSTKRCAELIRDGVGEDVNLVDLRDTPRPAVDDFDVVLIGGSIYGGLIQREVVAFCGRNRDRLLARKVGLFICCLYREERAMEQLESGEAEADGPLPRGAARGIHGKPGLDSLRQDRGAVRGPPPVP